MRRGACRMIGSHVQYLKNRCIYGVWLKRPPTPLEIQLPPSRWDVTAIPHKTAVECPEVPGLWLIRQCIDGTSCWRMMDAFRCLSAQGTFPWYRYNFGRDMIPLHASPALDEAPSALDHAKLQETQPGHVFGTPGSSGADPIHGWPRLRQLLKESTDGARELEQLQDLPRQYIPQHFDNERCLFIQAQALEPGAEVTAHKDPLPYGGHAIATAVLEGASDIRVGQAQFRVDAGDVYALVGNARYDVDHEVFSASSPRTSITLRYGLSFRSGYDLSATGSAWLKEVDSPAV